MKKPAGLLFAFAWIALITLMLTITVAHTESTNSTYYSNNFDSPSSLNDGYWQANDTTVTDGKLQINGKASFNPHQGEYSLNNFTVQFDVYHDIKYANNTAYSGPFYQLCDSQNRTIILLGYFQVETNGQTHTEGCFENLINYHHYYFPYNQTTNWSTWCLSGYIQQMTDDGLYLGNFTIQINNETITSFRSDSIIPEGTVHNITNEEVKPIAYFNIYPLPQTGVMIIPTTSTNNGIHFSTLSSKIATIQYAQAIPSYVDNFLYGYANKVPVSVTSTPTPTSTPTFQERENNIESTPISTPEAQIPTPSPPVPEFSRLTLLAILILLFFVPIVLGAIKKRRITSSNN